MIATAITFVIFMVIGVIEVFVLRAMKRLEAPKHLYYSVFANTAGFLITAIISTIMIFFMITIFAAMLGGVGTVFIGSLITFLILLVLIPLLTFGVRFFLFRLFKVPEMRFRIIYSVLSTICVFVILNISWAIVMFVLLRLIPNV